ncbi:hypothetical protein NC651_022827 [Populus alba x Populus x berolinensis]|nr:hypothetical protein NC651_022827 [Populus alba x Populus x berolinensis]
MDEDGVLDIDTNYLSWKPPGSAMEGNLVFLGLARSIVESGGLSVSWLSSTTERKTVLLLVLFITLSLIDLSSHLLFSVKGLAEKSTRKPLAQGLSSPVGQSNENTGCPS